METLVHKPDGTLKPIDPHHVGREVRFSRSRSYQGTITKTEGQYRDEVMVTYAKYNEQSLWVGRTLSTPKVNLEFLDEL